MQNHRVDGDHHREIAGIAHREAADRVRPRRGAGPALPVLPLDQVIPLVVVEVGWQVARVILFRGRPERAQVHAVPLRAVHHVDVLEPAGNRFDGFDEVAQQHQIVDRRLGDVPGRRQRGKEYMRHVAEVTELRPALGRVHQVDADVRVRPFDVRRAARQGDDFPPSGLQKMAEQVAADHAGCAGDERFLLYHVLSRHHLSPRLCPKGRALFESLL